MADFRSIRDSEITPEIRAEWQRVFEADPTARWSQSPDWAESSRATYGRGFQLWTEWENGRMQAAVPMRWNGTVFAGDASDSAAPVLFHPEAGKLLMDHARSRPTRWTAVADDSRWAAHLPLSALIDSETNLQLRLSGDFDAYVQSLSKSLRYEVRRRTQFSIRASTSASATDDIAVLLKLHRERWRKRGLPGLFFGRRGQFFSNWVIRGIEAGKVEILVAESSGEPVGAACFMLHGGRTGFYQSGVRPVAGSPGTALVAEAISRAIARGDHTFDFLRGDEPYKRRWRPDTERAVGRYLLPLDRGQLPLHIRGAWWKLEAIAYRKLRTRFEGKGLS